MNAILLAAGMGTRLYPITEKVPKCLVPINGEPLLGIWIRKLKRLGVDSILINTHYLNQQVEDFIKQSPFKKSIKLVHEAELIGTAGTLISNLDFFKNNDGLLIHADNYCISDLSDLVDKHFKRPVDCELTMLTFRTNTPSECGIVEVDSNQIMTGFHEKSQFPLGNLANAAVFVLSPTFIKRMNNYAAGAFDFSADILPRMLKKTFVCETKDFYIDIGTINNYKIANSFRNK
jgi:mannose-1-phosphate guanylyltransferase